MSLKSGIAWWLLLLSWLSSVAQEKIKHIPDADIKTAFIAAVDNHRITHKSYIGVGWLNIKEKSYDDCMDYDFVVQGSRVALYYCFDNPHRAIIEWHDLKSWTDEKRQLLYTTLQSSSPVLKQ